MENTQNFVVYKQLFDTKKCLPEPIKRTTVKSLISTELALLSFQVEEMFDHISPCWKLDIGHLSSLANKKSFLISVTLSSGCGSLRLIFYWRMHFIASAPHDLK